MRAFILAVVLWAVAVPGVALAQNDPFGPLPQPAPQQPVQPSPSPSQPTNGSNDGLQGWQEALIFGGGGILLLGIGWAILADARRRAPTSEEELHGPKHDAHRQQRKAQARAKARRAKASRKRNR
jgi:hypothetical protein